MVELAWLYVINLTIILIELLKIIYISVENFDRMMKA